MFPVKVIKTPWLLSVLFYSGLDIGGIHVMLHVIVQGVSIMLRNTLGMADTPTSSSSSVVSELSLPVTKNLMISFKT